MNPERLQLKGMLAESKKTKPKRPTKTLLYREPKNWENS